MNVLDEAKEVVGGARQAQYGSPKQSFKIIAAMWTEFLGYEISPRDVCNMMILLKVARDSHRPKHDNMVDVCGYAFIADEISEDSST